MSEKDQIITILDFTLEELKEIVVMGGIPELIEVIKNRMANDKLLTGLINSRAVHCESDPETVICDLIMYYVEKNPTLLSLCPLGVLDIHNETLVCALAAKILMFPYAYFPRNKAEAYRSWARGVYEKHKETVERLKFRSIINDKRDFSHLFPEYVEGQKGYKLHEFIKILNDKLETLNKERTEKPQELSKAVESANEAQKGLVIKMRNLQKNENGAGHHADGKLSQEELQEVKRGFIAYLDEKLKVLEEEGEKINARLESMLEGKRSPISHLSHLSEKEKLERIEEIKQAVVDVANSEQTAVFKGNQEEYKYVGVCDASEQPHSYVVEDAKESIVILSVDEFEQNFDLI